MLLRNVSVFGIVGFLITANLACVKPVYVSGPEAYTTCEVRPLTEWSPNALSPTNLYCEAEPYNYQAYKVVVMYFEDVPRTWRFEGDAIPIPQIQSGQITMPGTCQLLLTKPENQDWLHQQLQQRGIPTPTKPFETHVLNPKHLILEANSEVHSFVEVIRAGNNVWLLTSTCGLS